jgi:hypothetical protein
LFSFFQLIFLADFEFRLISLLVHSLSSFFPRGCQLGISPSLRLRHPNPHTLPSLLVLFLLLSVFSFSYLSDSFTHTLILHYREWRWRQGRKKKGEKKEKNKKRKTKVFFRFHYLCHYLPHSFVLPSFSLFLFNSFFSSSLVTQENKEYDNKYKEKGETARLRVSELRDQWVLLCSFRCSFERITYKKTRSTELGERERFSKKLLESQ